MTVVLQTHFSISLSSLHFTDMLSLAPDNAGMADCNCPASLSLLSLSQTCCHWHQITGSGNSYDREQVSSLVFVSLCVSLSQRCHHWLQVTGWGAQSSHSYTKLIHYARLLCKKRNARQQIRGDNNNTHESKQKLKLELIWLHVPNMSAWRPRMWNPTSSDC